MTSNFFFSQGVFYQFEELFAIFIKFEIVVCKLFQFADNNFKFDENSKNLKFVIWKREKSQNCHLETRKISNLSFGKELKQLFA